MMIKKICLSFMIVTLLLFALITTSVSIFIKPVQTAIITDRNRELVQSIQSSFNRQQNNLAIQVSHYARMINVNPNQAFDRARLLQTLTAIRQSSAIYLDVSVANLSGRVFDARMKGWVPGFNAKAFKRDWFQSITEGNQPSHISAPYFSDAKISAIPVSTPIMIAGQCVGVFIIDIDITSLLPQTAAMQYLFANRNGKIIYTNTANQSQQNQPVAQLYPQWQTLTQQPQLYQDSTGKWLSISKQSISPDLYLYAITSQDSAMQLSDYVHTLGIAVLLLTSTSLLVIALFFIRRQHQQLLPTIAERIMQMASFAENSTLNDSDNLTKRNSFANSNRFTSNSSLTNKDSSTNTNGLTTSQEQVVALRPSTP